MRADELGQFLRSRRERLGPTDVGLPASGSRRTPGLRREEVAVLAGVGVSWLTRLEQGRAQRVSDGVLHGLADALRLTATERAHLYGLAGVHLPAPPVAGDLDDIHRRLLDGLNPNPAYLLDHEWCLAGWNDAEAQLFPLLDTAGPRPNLLELFLRTPELRSVIDDWPMEIERLTRQLRAHLTRHPSERLADLAEDLAGEHPEFRVAWERQDVAPLSPRRRTIVAPSGPLHFEQHRLGVADHPGWQLVLFVPAPPSAS